jgi:hypothetical protein
MWTKFQQVFVDFNTTFQIMLIHGVGIDGIDPRVYDHSRVQGEI